MDVTYRLVEADSTTVDLELRSAEVRNGELVLTLTSPHLDKKFVPVPVRDLTRLDSFLSWLLYRHGSRAQLPEALEQELVACAATARRYASPRGGARWG